jgi:uncharacterized protein YbjT (DUF2867 family)
VSSRTALIAGASGLVGRHCLDTLLASPAYEAVIACSRRPLPNAHTRLAVRVVSFDRLDSERPLAVTDAFCALGTTIAAAGSRDAFTRVDLGYVAAFARYARASGASRFVLVSSVGSDPGSSNFYLRVKGQAEQAVVSVGFVQVDILRPGLLLGERLESRRGEAIALRFAPAAGLLLGGPLRKYRPVPAAFVGAAMVGTALAEHSGVRVMHYDELVRMASSGSQARVEDA